MMKRIKTTATVSILVEVDLGQTWEEGCAFLQVHKQAREEAIGHLRKTLEGARAKMIGEPHVKVMTWEVDK
jgi:hypothetical protein